MDDWDGPWLYALLLLFSQSNRAGCQKCLMRAGDHAAAQLCFPRGVAWRLNRRMNAVCARPGQDRTGRAGDGRGSGAALAAAPPGCAEHRILTIFPLVASQLTSDKTDLIASPIMSRFRAIMKNWYSPEVLPIYVRHM